jgi:alkylation response protein AidB-like acyl-CoA dehydrogenase
MRLDLSDEQELLRDTTRRFLEREAPVEHLKAPDRAALDPTMWRQAADLGWTSLLVPADLGGGSLSGSPVADAAIVAEEMGRMAAPGPFLAVNLVAAAIATWGSDEQRDSVLPGLLDGSVVATWAHGEHVNRWDVARLRTRAVLDDADVVITGVKSYVEAAAEANWFLVTARTADGTPLLVLVPADTAGLEVMPDASLDLARQFGRITFDDVRLPGAACVGSQAEAEVVIEALTQIAIALQCADTIGATDRVFASTVAYSLERQAFGRAIGGYQALKHRFADMLLWLESSKATTEGVVEAVDASAPDAGRLASIAKAYVGQYSSTIMSDCQQIWGGISQTWDHDLHVFMRRVAVNRAVYGSPEDHRDRICSLLGIEDVDGR